MSKRKAPPVTSNGWRKCGKHVHHQMQRQYAAKELDMSRYKKFTLYAECAKVIGQLDNHKKLELFGLIILSLQDVPFDSELDNISSDTVAIFNLISAHAKALEDLKKAELVKGGSHA